MPLQSIPTVSGVLPWSNPDDAVKELERAMTKLHFSGVILSGRASGGAEFLDDKRFTPILEAGVQILRMILSGSFERFPKLQLIGGHWGENGAVFPFSA